MERKEFLKLGLVRLPPGFRFQPTDEELVVQYLKRKALSCPLPAGVIPEIDLVKYNPWDLPYCFGGERYFFYHRESKSADKKQSGRYYHVAGSGYWKVAGKEKQVLATRTNEVVGAKRELVFFRGKLHHGLKTDWIMNEYCLSSLSASGKEWVVCQIFEKRRGRKQRAGRTRGEENHRVPALSPSFSSSSSCLTDLTEEEFINGEEAMSNALIASPP